MKRLFNQQEEHAFNELNAVAESHGLSVFPKVRIADVLPIENSGIPANLYSYALKAHFDFVIYAENRQPEFAVEFDGPGHRHSAQQERDRKKNILCKHFGLPLLRTTASHISRKYRDLTILAWIIEVYQFQKAFYEAQANGIVPYDEPFDPFFVICGGKPGKNFPYWISLDARTRLRELHRQGRLAAPSTSGFIGRDDDEVMRGIEYIQVTDTEGLYVESAMRPQDFPLVFSDLLDELLCILLFEKVQNYLAGNEKLVPLKDIYARVKAMQSKLKMLRAHVLSVNAS